MLLKISYGQTITYGEIAKQITIKRGIKYTIDVHKKTFEYIASQLLEHIDRVFLVLLHFIIDLKIIFLN